VELKIALANFKKDRYVSSMMREELETVIQALQDLQAPKGPDVPLASIEEKLSEALALLKGERAPANSKSTPQKSPKSRKADRSGVAEAAPVAAKAKS
jgi:hypothetical protein